MNLFSSFTIIISIILTIFFDGTLEKKEPYCNQRFNYCLDYPTYYLTEYQTSGNGAGILLKSKDYRTRVRVAASHNVMNWTTEDINQFYLKELVEQPVEVSLMDLSSDPSESRMRLRYNYEIQLFRVKLVGDKIITTLITVPGSSPELLDQLDRQIEITFPAWD